MLGLTVFSAIISLAVAGANIRATRTQKLRLCNAYPGSEMFQVMLDKTDIVGDIPLQYKECRDVSQLLKTGDRLDFQASGLSRGSFTVGALAQQDSLLVLVFSKEDLTGTTLSFSSHVFVPSKNAQVAVIDTFRGKEEGRLVISEPLAHQVGATTVYGEALPFNSAMGVKDGFYEVLLVDKEDEAEVHVPLVIADGENYVIIRTGLDDGKLATNTLEGGVEAGASVLLQTKGHGGSTGGLMLGQLLAYKRYPQDVFVYPNPTQLEAKESTKKSTETKVKVESEEKKEKVIDDKVEKHEPVAPLKDGKSAAIPTPVSFVLVALCLALQ